MQLPIETRLHLGRVAQEYRVKAYKAAGSKRARERYAAMAKAAEEVLASDITPLPTYTWTRRGATPREEIYADKAAKAAAKEAHRKPFDTDLQRQATAWAWVSHYQGAPGARGRAAHRYCEADRAVKVLETPEECYAGLRDVLDSMSVEVQDAY